jgi:capsular polysaccharide biosynthesis protein
MNEFDLEIIQPEKMTLEEQIRVFSNCELIVGPFGSGLHNMIFSKSTNIVEIFPPNYTSKLNKAIAYAMGHKYMSLFGMRAAMKDEKYDEELVVRRSKDVSYKNVSFEVHPESLRTVLIDALSG